MVLVAITTQILLIHCRDLFGSGEWVAQPTDDWRTDPGSREPGPLLLALPPQRPPPHAAHFLFPRTTTCQLGCKMSSDQSQGESNFATILLFNPCCFLFSLRKCRTIGSLPSLWNTCMYICMYVTTSLWIHTGKIVERRRRRRRKRKLWISDESKCHPCRESD